MWEEDQLATGTWSWNEMEWSSSKDKFNQTLPKALQASQARLTKEVINTRDPAIRGSMTRHYPTTTDKLAQIPNSCSQWLSQDSVNMRIRPTLHSRANTAGSPEKGAQSSLSPSCAPQEVKPGMSIIHLALNILYMILGVLKSERIRHI